MPREEQVARAVEILRGTNYDFRVEATTDVVALYGHDVLIAALERLDAEIDAGPAARRPVAPSRPSRVAELAEERSPAAEEEQLTLPGPAQGTRMALADIQATLGGFLALALPYVEEADMQKLAAAAFRKLDAINAAARPAENGERVLSADETRQFLGDTTLEGLRELGFGSADAESSVVLRAVPGQPIRQVSDPDG